jgi:hypothetical protein
LKLNQGLNELMLRGLFLPNNPAAAVQELNWLNEWCRGLLRALTVELVGGKVADPGFEPGTSSFNGITHMRAVQPNL